MSPKRANAGKTKKMCFKHFPLFCQGHGDTTIKFQSQMTITYANYVVFIYINGTTFTGKTFHFFPSVNDTERWEHTIEQTGF